MGRGKYEKFTFNAVEVNSRDDLIEAIKNKSEAILVNPNIDKALALTVEQEKKKRKRKFISRIVKWGGIIAFLFTSHIFTPLIAIVGASLGGIAKQELKKYDIYEQKFHGEIMCLMLRKKVVDIKLDTIMVGDEILM